MASVSSLSQLYNSAKSLIGREVMIPVDDEFVNSIHSSSLIKENENNTYFFSLLFRNLQKRVSCSSPDVKLGIPKLIFSYAAEAIISSREGEFMGPLCSPMRKSHASILRSNKYFVTEKSDGTRVILVSLRASNFPCWLFSENDSNTEYSLPLNDVITLEEIRQELNEGKLTSVENRQLQLSFGLFYIEHQNLLSPNQEEEIFILKSYHENNISDLKCTISIIIRRRIGVRHMAYCFDRSMEKAFLLLEEYSVPLLSSFALDCELMITVNSNEINKVNQLLLGCFDVFRYTELKENLQNDIRLTRYPMSKRYDVLKDVIINPIQNFQILSLIKGPIIKLFAKEILPLEKFNECVSRLKREVVDDSSNSVVYYYNGPYGLTKSDGFIFTPEKFDLVQGASKYQLKWKWPSFLSVDWSLTAIEGKLNRYIVDLFFRKKRFGHRPDSVGRARLSSDMYLLNPHLFVIPKTNFIVAECIFNYQEKCWSIERLRTDKSEPNSVVTVISVLESLVEDITLDVLINIIGAENTISNEFVESLQQSVQPIIKKKKDNENFIPRESYEFKTCQFTLRATQLQTQGEHEIHLYWAVRLLSEKQHIPCIHCKVSECTGLGFTCPAEDTTSKLTEYLYIALANAGGSYAWSDFTVEGVFDGNSGRWKIVSLHPNGNNRNSTCVGVIKHLQWLLQVGKEKSQLVLLEEDKKNLNFNIEKSNNLMVDKINIHYACKTKELSKGKNRSLLRQFNNWIKSVLISTAIPYIQLNDGKEKLNNKFIVGDLCSGRGGDLFKWRAHKPQLLFMVDSCLEAVAEAAARYCVSKGLSIKVTPQDKNHAGLPVFFSVCDVFDENGILRLKIEDFFKQNNLQNKRMDIISCQFSLHYGCSSENRVCEFLRAVSTALRSGGVFIGTTVNDLELLNRARERGNIFGNSIYKIRFPSDIPSILSFGIEYFVSVENSVSELPEYIVPWDHFIVLCNSFDLQLVESFGFLEYSELHYSSSIGQELRDTVGGGGSKRDSDGHVLLQLSPEEKEAASLFRTFIFVKK